ncbi:hypothetical protein LXA43DRAFT_1127629 [Ganoderma leucocontextum]|nr:hypothetical protein LXA43DRAFT_1127629 [Ganoderma leucocontextum]
MTSPPVSIALCDPEALLPLVISLALLRIGHGRAYSAHTKGTNDNVSLSGLHAKATKYAVEIETFDNIPNIPHERVKPHIWVWGGCGSDQRRKEHGCEGDVEFGEHGCFVGVVEDDSMGWGGLLKKLEQTGHPAIVPQWSGEWPGIESIHYIPSSSGCELHPEMITLGLHLMEVHPAETPPGRDRYSSTDRSLDTMNNEYGNKFDDDDDGDGTSQDPYPDEPQGCGPSRTPSPTPFSSEPQPQARYQTASTPRTRYIFTYSALLRSASTNTQIPQEVDQSSSFPQESDQPYHQPATQRFPAQQGNQTYNAQREGGQAPPVANATDGEDPDDLSVGDILAEGLGLILGHAGGRMANSAAKLTNAAVHQFDRAYDRLEHGAANKLNSVVHGEPQPAHQAHQQPHGAQRQGHVQQHPQGRGRA